METSRTDLLASCKPTSVSKSTNTKPISPTKNTNIQRPFKKRVHFKKQCNIDDEEFIDSLNNILWKMYNNLQEPANVMYILHSCITIHSLQ